MSHVGHKETKCSEWRSADWREADWREHARTWATAEVNLGPTAIVKKWENEMKQRGKNDAPRNLYCHD